MPVDGFRKTEMEIQYYLTEADILELMRYRLRQAPKRQNPILVRRLAYLVGFMLIALGSITIARNVVLMPSFVNLAIVEVRPSMKGGSVTARTKPATLSTGMVVQVPEYISNGEIIRIDTRTGEYAGKA